MALVLQQQHYKPPASLHSVLEEAEAADHEEDDEVDELPPPPSPFPQSFQALSEASAASVEGDEEATETTDASDFGLLQSTAPEIELDLVGLQRACVDALEALLPHSAAESIHEDDRRLAAALSELLEASYEFEAFHAEDAILSPTHSCDTSFVSESPFTALVKVLLTVQMAAEARTPRAPTSPAPEEDVTTPEALALAREDVAWARLQSLSQAIVALVHERDPPTPTAPHVLPPGYTTDLSSEAGESESLPSYHGHQGEAGRSSGSHEEAYKLAGDKGKVDLKSGDETVRARHSRATIGVLNDIDTVTNAIERLQTVAPQMQNQRVELRSGKMAHRIQHSPMTSEADPVAAEYVKMRELEDIWDKIERTQGPGRSRGGDDQRVDGNAWAARQAARRQLLQGAIQQSNQTSLEDALPDSPEASLQRARQLRERDTLLKRLSNSHEKRLSNQDMGLRSGQEQRNSFIQGIMDKTRDGRLSDQEAPPPTPKSGKLSLRSVSIRSRLTDERRSVKSIEAFEVDTTDTDDDKDDTEYEDEDDDEFDEDAIIAEYTFPRTPRSHPRSPHDLEEEAMDQVLQRMPFRLSQQDCPPPTPMSFQDKQHGFYEALAASSRVGRLHNQDTLPPTPRSPARSSFGPGTPRSPARSTFAATGTPRSPARSTFADSPQFPERPTFSRRSSLAPTIKEPHSRSTSATTIRSPVPNNTSNNSSGIRKISQIVKRGSMALSLRQRADPQPTHHEFDAADVGYIIEHQEALRIVIVMIYGINLDSAPYLQLEVTSANDALLTCKRDASLRVAISLPTAVVQGQVVPIVKAGDVYFEAKLAAMPTQLLTLSLNTTIAHPLSAPNLRSLAPRSLCCTSCDREIARFPTGVNFKDLPSEHWAEMLEVWMCHADPAFTAHLARHTRDGFWPTDGTVLVGGSYLLIANEHICEGTLSVTESTEPDDWHIVSCPCGEVLGKERPKNGRPGEGTVRLSKWAIALLRGKGAGEVEPVRFPVSTFVVSDMLELAQAHAAHRFIISDEQTGDRRLAVWLFNPSIRVSYRRPANSFPLSPSHHGPSKGRNKLRRFSNSSKAPRKLSAEGLPFGRAFRAAKIMYKVLEPFSPDEPYEHLPGFGPLGQVEQLRYSRKVCVTLIEALRASSSLYPEPRRTMGSFDIGFLERA